MKNIIENHIFHIDVNSAYLSWEASDRIKKGEQLDLRTIPSVIGGDASKRRGIVLASSIPAKQYGIKTGESIYSALNKCHNLVVAPPNYNLYMKCSNSMMRILNEFSPCIQRFSIDEVFLDFKGLNFLFDNPMNCAQQIQSRIKKELGFSVNIGISTNKLLAKMASDFEKPNKIHTLYNSEIKYKMWPLPIENLFGVGRATSPKLRKLGIKTIGDLANYNFNYIEYKFKSHGVMIWNYANGLDTTPITSENSQLKGISNSTTISFDVNNKYDAHMILLSLTETVGIRLRDLNNCCQVISVSVKNSTFDSYSHQKKLLSPIDSTNEIYELVKNLFNETWKGEPIRQLGIRLSDLCCNSLCQKSLFDNPIQEKNKALDKAMDCIRSKYGSGSLVRGSFIQSEFKPLSGGVDAEDYLMMSNTL